MPRTAPIRQPKVKFFTGPVKVAVPFAKVKHVNAKAPEKKKTAMIFCAQEEEASLLQAILEKNGIQLMDWNRTGVDWIDKWQAIKPNVVLVDYVMSKKDGMFILKNIKHHDPEAIVVFMHAFTGNASSELEMKALKLGARAILHKPLLEKKVSFCLERLFDK